jgi:hypothetical protein
MTYVLQIQKTYAGDLEGYDRLAARVKPAFGFGANVGRGFGHPPSVAETAITNPVARAG